MKKLPAIRITILVLLLGCMLDSCVTSAANTDSSSTPSLATTVAVTPSPQFNGDRANQDVINQVALGPRVPGSAAHDLEVEYIRSELKKVGWQVTIQDTVYQGHRVQNITASRSETQSPIILCAHYDSRALADRDKDEAARSQAVPGANDGASGVAVLLEIARVLPTETQEVWLVFFDAEDQGDFPNWDWALGASAYADALMVTPRAVVLLDMIGDADLNIYREGSSTKALQDEIWQTAADLGYSAQFIDSQKYTMIDDHTPFLNKGIPAVDLIDFDYLYWHTSQDTADKVSAQSLEIVGNVLLAWLKTK
jgi:Zn-dependent M28 family amino/carboxypeptidase